MSFGAALRLLRVGSGQSLRTLAGAVGVSSAYLSRVEHGHDPAPTPDRLVAIAHALHVPPSLLLELAERVAPEVADYLAEVPSANRLFLEIARRRLTPAQIARVLAFVEAEDPPARGAPPPTPLHTLVRPERVMLGVRVGVLEDALALAASRLAAGGPGGSAATLAEALAERERTSPTAIGGGLAVPHCAVPGGPPTAALVTLHPPLGSGPDGEPVRVLLVLAGVGPGDLPLLGRAALLGRGRAGALIAEATTPEGAIRALELAERWSGG